MSPLAPAGSRKGSRVTLDGSRFGCLGGAAADPQVAQLASQMEGMQERMRALETMTERILQQQQQSVEAVQALTAGLGSSR